MALVNLTRWKGVWIVLLFSLYLCAPALAAEPLRILALGDSLTAGFQLPADQSFPAQLERALSREKISARVINAGVSGDTSAGGLARLDWALADKPDAVILELGANDGLRGLAPEQMSANLDTILTRLKQRGLKILLAGMFAPPNYGKDYARAFNAVYPSLAAKHGVMLYPFFLEGVAGRPERALPDGMHPNAAGVAVMVENILPYVKKALIAPVNSETQGDMEIFRLHPTRTGNAAPKSRKPYPR